MLTAALDAARLGARAPLSADFLRAAAPGYCTSQQQAEAPENWFEQALAYATGKLHGAAAALSPAGAGMGQVAGYTAADYLIQHASRERRYARVPASTWDAVLSHIRDPADTARLADSARNRLLYRYAIPLYRHAADAGDGDAAGGWPTAGRARRPGRGRADTARRADAGDEDAACGWPSCWPSAATWTRDCAPGPTPATGMPPGSWPTCWPSAATWTGCATRARNAGDEDAAVRLAELLAERGDLDGLRARADAGDGYAAWRLAELLAERGDLDGLRARADAGDGRRLAAGRAAGRARRPGRAVAPGPTPATGCRRAAGRAAGRARRPGRADRYCAPGPTPATGMPPSGWPSCWPSAATWTGCAPGPTPATDAAGGWPSCWPSAATWTGCAPGPTPATGTPPGGWPSCWPSAATWTGCAPGPTPATGMPPRLAELLAELLIKQGRGEEAERLRRFGLNPDGSIACA